MTDLERLRKLEATLLADPDILDVKFFPGSKTEPAANVLLPDALALLEATVNGTGEDVTDEVL